MTRPLDLPYDALEWEHEPYRTFGGREEEEEGDDA